MCETLLPNAVARIGEVVKLADGRHGELLRGPDADGFCVVRLMIEGVHPRFSRHIVSNAKDFSTKSPKFPVGTRVTVTSTARLNFGHTGTVTNIKTFEGAGARFCVVTFDRLEDPVVTLIEEELEPSALQFETAGSVQVKKDGRLGFLRNVVNDVAWVFLPEESCGPTAFNIAELVPLEQDVKRVPILPVRFALGELAEVTATIYKGTQGRIIAVDLRLDTYVLDVTHRVHSGDRRSNGLPYMTFFGASLGPPQAFSVSPAVIHLLSRGLYE